MQGSEQTGDGQKTVEELQKELTDSVKNYEKLNTAHEKLKADLTSMKATSSDANELQKQIEKHVTDKSKLLREKEELARSFDDYKKDSQKKEMRSALTTALDEAGARNSSTALKLIDLETIKFDDKGQVLIDSLTQAIDALKTSDPVLFKEEGEADPKALSSPAVPSIKDAVNKVSKTAYETEMAAAVEAGDQKKLEAVFEKYYRVT
jgi:DNA repair exonuclease SbcCD ATPase subunit